MAILRLGKLNLQVEEVTREADQIGVPVTPAGDRVADIGGWLEEENETQGELVQLGGYRLAGPSHRTSKQKEKPTGYCGEK